LLHLQQERGIFERCAPAAFGDNGGGSLYLHGNAEMSSTKKSAERLIKKYPNRRLYDTQTSSYITLTDVKQLVLDADTFTVVDAKSSEDLTRSILLQIILEEEANGAPMFSSVVLSQIIRYYGHAMQGMMGSYLEKNVQAFTDIQNKFTGTPAGSFEGKPFSPEMWTQFMNVQGPMMQGMMNNYIEQSKSLFVQMQEQMQNQSKSLFGAFPFGPVVPPSDKK
jgi:polyhydroxyalkanoate synthesis repressor PhaR